ncbi:MAG: leucine-rich repeat domain-containing protein [Bacteroidaceae bacterium]|nr:leucine-rich repeat domain-containing protein [Bacteroidaceae bacterium]
MKTRLLLTLTALLLALSSWANGTEIDGIHYELDSSTETASVTYTGSSYSSNNTYSGSITIPASVNYSGITYSVTSIGERTFYNCTGLTSITIPNSVRRIRGSAFRGCSGLTSITIPSSVTSIGDYAFGDCTGLTSITIPSSVTSIGKYAFDGCTGLTSITIPSSVTSIGERTFSGCSGLTSITIPSSVTTIGYGAFYGCTGLTSITIPSSVTRIGSRAFRDCTGLTKVVINGGFYNRSGFTFIDVFGDQVEELTLGKDVTKSLASYEGCTKLTSVTIHSDNISPSIFGSQVKKFTLGEGVTTIRQRAFFPGFPSGTFDHGELTFQPTALEEVYLPSTLRTIGNWAFQFCVNLKRIHFQEGLDSISPGAFTYCLKLESLNLPASVRGFGEGQGCLLACKDITLDEANPYLTLQDGVLFNKEKTILLQYPAAREGESYRIPDGVKTVLGYSFEGNSSLKSLTIPASVDSMGRCWYEYTRLSEIRMESSVPPRSADSNLWFDNSGLAGSWLYPAYDFKNSVTLYVPRGSKETYAATAPWSDFTNIVEYDVTGIQSLTLNPSEAGQAYYNLQGQRIATPQRGQLVIVRNADGTSRKMLVQ